MAAVREITHYSFHNSQMTAVAFSEPSLDRRPVTMWTSARQTAFLDEIAVCVRLNFGRVLSRGEIVSAILEAAFSNGVDFTSAVSEADVTDIARRAFSRSDD
jgi:hypothetical protein